MLFMRGNPLREAITRKKRLMRQNLQPRLSHKEGVLPLGGRQLVLGDDGPAIGAIDEDFPCAHVDHWLNGEHHARDKKHTCAFLSIVQHLGVVVELDTYTMAAEVAYHAETVLVGVLLDGIADVAYKTKRLGGFHTDIKAFFGHVH